MVNIDTLVDGELIREYASRIDDVPHEFISHFEQHFEGGQSDEFYLGLFKGISNAYSEMESQDQNFKQSPGATLLMYHLSFLADKMLNKRTIH